MRRATAVLLFAGLASASAMTTQPDVRLDSRVQGRLREAVVAIMDSAQREGLPLEPLVQQTYRGVSTRLNPRLHVTDLTIIASVRRLAFHLRQARAALGPRATEADINAASVAIENGASPQQLERLRSAREGVRIASALDVLTYTITAGVQSDTATNVIVGLVLASATDQQLQALKEDIDHDIAGGNPATLAMSARGQGLASQIAAAQPNNGGARAGALPSGLGSTRAGEPGAGALGGGAGAAGAVSPGGSKPAPAGTRKKP